MKGKFFFIALLLINIAGAVGQSNSSVLQSGNWFKIGVTGKGVYKIDRAYLENLGINVSSLDPKKLAIYGNGGNGMLPQDNSVPRPSDLLENAILISGQEDGSFDTNDFLLFYGNSPDFIAYNSENDFFQYEKNLYSDTTFYFLTIKGTDGMRVPDRASSEAVFDRVNTYKNVFIHETDETNLIRGGRMWFGELFSAGQQDQNISFDSKNILPGGQVKVLAVMMAQAFEETSFDLSLNGVDLGNIAIDRVPNRTYVEKGDLQAREFEVNASELSNPASGLTMNMHYNVASSGPSTGYLDYLVIQAVSELNMAGNKLHFYNTTGTTSTTFEISAPAGTSIWDISDPTRVVNQQLEVKGDKLVFNVETPTTEFVAFSGNNFPSPVFIDKIENQNLHGHTASDAVFITHKNFLIEAQALANHRETMIPGFSIRVVTVDQVYNEFSSGMQDISAIRDYIRYIYNQDPGRLKYALLFGDCSYDYKDRTITKSNFVPVYEARNSLNPLYNFSSDDFFGFMEENEGEWAEDKAGDHTLEIGIGRLPVKTRQEAREVVDKIIRYDTSPNTFGKWRNEMLFIADDGDNNIHQRDANFLATYVEQTRSEFNADRLFIDAYEQLSSPSGQSSPAARKAFEKAINEGKLMINYTGHGNEAQLTVEKIIDENQISDLKNRSRLPFFITATCEFGNYDNPDRVSGGEKALLNPNGGAIALLTSTRPVFSNTNFILNEAYYLAALQKENGEFPRLGDIIKNTKNNSLEGAKNRNFALLGDPTMRLAFPKYELAITSVNGKVTNQADTLKALGKIRMNGEVRRPDRTVVENFSGKVSVAIYDKPTKFSTRGDENTVPQKFDQWNALLFKGDASVENGFFTLEFIVPKNISYIFGEGKISMYAISNDNQPVDANGANVDLKVGGSDPNAPEDSTPPVINLFMNDSTFISGQTTGSSPLFLAKLFDESGINISNEGFGQDISLTIDDGEEIVLNEFYSAALDTYQQGWVSYPLSDLDRGKHSIKFRVYDTYNNVAEKEIEFVVSGDLLNVSAYPNPFSGSTADGVTFTFDHNRNGDELDVLLQILNLQGRVISESRFRFDDSSSGINSIKWDGKDADGNMLDNGIYIYKLRIRSTLDGAKNQAHRKLVVFN